MKADYYIVPYIEELATVTDPEREQWLRRRISANIGNQEALGRILGLTDVDGASLYSPDTFPTLSTTDTIDAFLEKFGPKERGASQPAPSAPEGAGVVPVVPAIDYMAMTELEKIPASEEPSPSEEPQSAETPALTESFAKILIKNGNYERAMEILTDVNLKNPEKSIYFADQMRFLRKLQLLQGR